MATGRYSPGSVCGAHHPKRLMRRATAHAHTLVYIGCSTYAHDPVSLSVCKGLSPFHNRDSEAAFRRMSSVGILAATPPIPPILPGGPQAAQVVFFASVTEEDAAGFAGLLGARCPGGSG